MLFYTPKADSTRLQTSAPTTCRSNAARNHHNTTHYQSHYRRSSTSTSYISESNRGSSESKTAQPYRCHRNGGGGGSSRERLRNCNARGTSFDLP